MSRLSDPIPTIRVLHIDDEASYLEITKICVEESNPFIQVQSCISPGQAISEITKGAFDCVLSDYLMDEMDGLELACKILEISDIPIIMYTGQGSEEIAERAFEIGIDDYIMKEATSSHYQVLAKRIVSAVERKRTLDLLSESEKKYRRLWEDSSDGLVLVDKLSGGILDFNEEFIWQTGRGRGELQSLKLWDILPPNTRESIRERFLEERDEGSVTSAKITFQKPSGEIVDIDLLSREIKIGDQEVLQGRCRDITEQKRYWERLETLHKHASELSRTKDEKEVSRFTLDGIEEIFGFQKMSFSLVQGMIIRPVEIRSNSPLSRTEIPLDGVGLIAKVARTGESMLISDVLKETDYYMARESTRSELTVPVKIGDEVVAVINIESSELDAISPEDQRLVEIFAEHIASAISINRESSKLRISEEKYRSLFESTHEGVLVSGPDGRYTSANPAAAAILGYDSPDDIIGLSAVDFYAEPEQRDEVYEALMEKGYITDYEHEIKRKDGSRGLISTNVTLHKTDDGGILRSEVFFRDITESKKLEERLRESEARLRLFMDSATDGFSLLDSDLNIIDINDARIAMTPSTREWLVGRNIRELYPLNELRMRNRVKLLTRILETGEAETLTDIIRHPRFGEKDVMVRVFKVGEGLGIITTDISEIRKLEERLWKSEALYRELAERSIDVIYKVDLEGRLQYVSPSVESITGHRPEELIGKSYLKFLQADQRTGVVDAISEAVKGTQIQGYQTEITAKNGRKLSVEVNSSLILEEGKPMGFQGVIRDVTARKKIEDELRESEERYRSLVELSPDVIMTFDFKGFVTSVNPAIEKLSGFSPDELVGKHFSKLGYFRLRDIPRYTRIVNSIVRGKIPLPIEFPYVHKNGTPKWAEAHVGYVYERGSRVGIQCVVMDITDRKIVEEELKEHASSLEELVKRRSQELVEAEMMVTAGKMASMVGHDLRGPLSNIKNSLYLIERKPEMLEKLKPLIFNSVDYALNMIEELRLITRTAEPTLMETNLGNLVQRAVDEAQIPNEVEVETQIGEGLASAQLDRTQIRRVLDNLIRNAVEAMSDGGTLILSLETEDGDIILNVEDTGNGIPEEDKPNIFTPFYTTKSNGMGLGLAYCKRAVEAHGGAITWVSKIGVGTTFTVKLPLKPD